ncbi:hypothetical protein DSO57_1000190 [Entomophthora muscae]|uniref:Uncharacterized protein n=1 Tax=Entomophthora muscae TaxID=34485 RepID=A0ACC2U7T2_9FUNG|nr:hypothetical protein DSO57_1000190 [Entomophthora muscae]
MQTSKIIIAFCALLVQGAPFQSNNALVRRSAYGKSSAASAPANKAPVYGSKPAASPSAPANSKDLGKPPKPADQAPVYGSKPAAEPSAPAKDKASSKSPKPADAAEEKKKLTKAMKCHIRNTGSSAGATPSSDATKSKKDKDDDKKTADIKDSTNGADGVKDDNGTKGADGAKGENGSKGADGAKGEYGSNGADGVKNDNGTKRSDGSKGAYGTK